ncbi:MAG: agmatinase [Deltaproteobacteria bacterium]|nr:agmatinase [Deltaproteobacteria bacterium]
MSRQLFLEAHADTIMPGSPALVGLPLDKTATYRPGTGQAPAAIRAASDSIESYSPLLDLDLLDHPFADIGDLDFSNDSVENSLGRIEDQAKRIMSSGCPMLSMGGEHTITLALVRAALETYPDLVLIHADAHSDLRDRYEGSAINHATVMRRVVELVGRERLIQLGIRAGTKEEFGWMRDRFTLLSWRPAAEQELLRRTERRPVYLSLDLDVLDPACFPGTGNPEPGGWSYNDLERLLWAATSMNLVAADVVELSPRYDPSGVSAITAARVVRELLLILGLTH